MYVFAALTQLLVLPILCCTPRAMWQPQKYVAALYPAFVESPPVDAKKDGCCRTTFELCAAWSDKQYRPFVLVLLMAGVWTATQYVFNTIHLYYIEDRVAGADGQSFFAVASSIGMLVGLAVTLPGGKIIDCVGTTSIGLWITLINCATFSALPFTTDPTLMTVLVSLQNGLVMLMQAVIIPLAVETLPNQIHITRDVGGIVTAQALASIVASVYVGPLVSTLTPAGMPLPYEGSSRPEYSPFAYDVAYLLQAVLCFISAILVWAAWKVARVAKRKLDPNLY